MAPKGAPSAEAVADAVCGLMRVPASALWVRGSARAYYLQAACALDVQDRAHIAALAGIAVKTVYNTPKAPPELANIVRQVLGDPRIHALPVPDAGRVEVWRRLGGPGVRRPS